MRIRQLNGSFSVCKIPDLTGVRMEADFCFLSKTDEECSLVCRAADVPANSTQTQHGWRAFGVVGPLDFTLVGILSELTGILAGQGVPVFAVSTYDTDYLLVRENQASLAIEALVRKGHTVLQD